MRKILLLVLIAMMFFSSCAVQITEEAAVQTVDKITIDGWIYVHFIDVGQGDCIYVQSDDMNMLIDAGNPENGYDICEYLKSTGTEKLDYFVGTHPHSDHVGGASRVLGEFDVDTVFMTDEISTSSFFEKLLDVMYAKNITVTNPEVGAVHKIGNTSFEFLSPADNYSDLNNQSIVMRINYGETSILLTGDSERPVETDLLERMADIDADVLKVGHHGSNNGSCDEFLKAVSPQIAVIQSGKGNSYGHPHKEVLSRLKKYNAEVYRNDKLGTIVLKSDGKQFYYDDKVITTEVSEMVDEQIRYIGNLNSKKYHVPGCGGLPAEKNRIYFNDKDEALSAGYNPCGSCLK